MQSPTERILVQKENGVGYLIFNHEARRNALSVDMWEGIATVMGQFDADDSVRVVVLRGAGEKAFSAGADISQFDKTRQADAGASYSELVGRGYAAITGSPKPTIAQIYGFCMGGGMAVALCCDLRFAATGSVFGIPAAKLGIGYAAQHLAPLVTEVGPMATKEILYTGRKFSAEEAKDMGFLTRILAPEDLAAHVADYAASIAANAPLSLRSTKLIVRELQKDAHSRDLDACHAAVKACAGNEDHVEGSRAFLEKRKPQFKGV